MRVMVKVYYEGKKYWGYQRQPNVLTVEGAIIRRLTEIGYIKNPKQNKFQSASRTDRYVNAIANVFAFNTEEKVNLDYINAKITKDKSIICWAKTLVEKDFSPKYSNWKRYWYVLPIRYLKERLIPTREKIRELCNNFVGEHDYRLFCKVDHRETKREIKSINIYESENKIIIEFKASSFLWEQIRRIIAYILAYNNLDIELQDTKKLLESPEDIKTLNIQPAEPDKLILIEHHYRGITWEESNKALNTVKERLEKIINKLDTEKLLQTTIKDYFINL